MSVTVTNIETVAMQPSDKSFCRPSEAEGFRVLRDSWVLIEPESTASKALTAGYSVVYPGCRTGGHSHENSEEIYHITRGRGVMTVGDQEFEVKVGDTYIVSPKQYHTMRNPSQGVLEYFWVVLDLQEGR